MAITGIQSKSMGQNSQQEKRKREKIFKKHAKISEISYGVDCGVM